MLVSDSVCILMLRVVMGLLRMVRMMALRLELGHRHSKSLVPLSSVHHDVLPLVALSIHVVRVVVSG